ncbi:trypsin-like serine protease [bacterium 19MO03SA05]|uniref:Trypsin-like serine protease n=1 Tax=bacterium 19MO03SA05 TaxID=2920620 RepID=A0AAU6VHY3_UNCXX
MIKKPIQMVILCLTLLMSPMVFADLTSRIVNGKPTTITTYPSFVSLFYDRIEYDRRYSPASFCGGTLLDDRHVLTAAHCLFDGRGSLDIPWLLFTVATQVDNESDFPNGNITTVRGEAFFYHPNYDDSVNSLWANDIAIIRLERGLNGQGFVNRPTGQAYRLGFNGRDDDDNDGIFEAVGHGNTRSGFDEDDRLLFTTMQYVSNARCQLDITPFALALNPHHLCFKGDGINPDSRLANGTCQGDSGGPIYWNNAGHLVQVGITSFGPAECGVGFPQSQVTSVFTEIYGYRQWIDQVLNGQLTANYIVTEEARLAFLAGSGNSSVSPAPIAADSGSIASPNASGGGAIDGFISAVLLLLGYARYQQKRK